MKSLFCLVVLGLFSAAMMGCSASAEVGDPDDTTVRTSSSSSDTYRKTTTTIEPDGDRTTRTEVKVDR